MEHAPAIILVGAFGIAILILTIVLLAAALVLIKKGRKQREKRLQVLGKLCLVLGGICAAPLILAAGYILYLSVS